MFDSHVYSFGGRRKKTVLTGRQTEVFSVWIFKYSYHQRSAKWNGKIDGCKHCPVRLLCMEQCRGSMIARRISSCFAETGTVAGSEVYWLLLFCASGRWGGLLKRGRKKREISTLLDLVFHRGTAPCYHLSQGMNYTKLIPGPSSHVLGSINLQPCNIQASVCSGWDPI